MTGPACRLAVFALVGVIAGPLAAQPKPPPAAKIETKIVPAEEHKVFMQLLEYLHRDTFPPNQLNSEPKTSAGVLAFVEQRRKMVGHVRTRLRDMKASPELIDMYDDYVKLLNEAEAFALALRRHEDEYTKGLNRIRDRYAINVQIAKLNGNANLVERNAWSSAYSLSAWWGRNPVDRFRGALAGTVLQAGNYIAADLRLHAQVLGLLNRAKDSMAAYERDNYPKLRANLQAEERRFVGSMAAKRDDVLKRGNDDLKKLTLAQGWKPGEVTLAPFVADDAKSLADNPFASLSHLNRMNAIESAKQAEACEKAAGQLLAMVRQLPEGTMKDSTKVYKYIRADMAFLAGMHANRASEYYLGGDGFRSAIKVKIPTGEVGLEAIKLYAEALPGMTEPPYPKAIVQHQKALAWAYAGTPHRAYLEVAELRSKDLAGMSDPKFYYECSRLYCLGNEAGIRTGLKYLSAAFALGYRNSERARLCPEMEILRKTNPGLFEQAVSLSASK